jgi:hypothetical protein
VAHHLGQQLGIVINEQQVGHDWIVSGVWTIEQECQSHFLAQISQGTDRKAGHCIAFYALGDDPEILTVSFPSPSGQLVVPLFVKSEIDAHRRFCSTGRAHAVREE